MSEPVKLAADAEDRDGARALQPILDALRGLRFGSVTVVVQDGVIVQVERIEKRRLARTARLDVTD